MGIGLIGGKLDQVRDDIYRAVSVIRQELLRPLHARLDWKSIDQTTFNATADAWWVAATESARAEFGPPFPADAKLTPQQGAFFRELHALLSRSNDGWDRLNVLQDAAARFGKPLQARPLPNPKLWSICCENYAALALRWPKLYREYDGGLKNARALLQAGKELQDAVGRISRDDWGKVSPAFLASLLASHKAQVAALERLLRQRFEYHAGAGSPLKGVNPFRSAKQQQLSDFVLNPERPDRNLPPLDYKTAAPLISGAGSTPGIASGYAPGDPANKPDPNVKLDPGTIPLSPAELQAVAALVPAEYRAAEQLGLGKIRVGYAEAGVGDEVVINRDKVVYSQSKQFSPGAAMPKEIADNFPFTKGFTVNVRFGRVFMVVKATFTPSQQAAEPLLIFSRKMTFPAYYKFMWANKGVDFRLDDADRQSVVSRSLPDAFQFSLPTLKKQLVDGKGVETDPAGVQKGSKAIAALVESYVAEKRQGMLDAIAGQFKKPGGEVLDVSDQISGARLLLLHFLCLGFGDWINTTEEGKAFQKVAQSLQGGDELRQQIATEPARYLNPETRDDAFALLGSAAQPLDDKIKEALGRHEPPAAGDPKKFAKAPLDASFGRHLIVEQAMGRLQMLLVMQADRGNVYFGSVPGSEEVVTPAAPNLFAVYVSVAVAGAVLVLVALLGWRWKRRTKGSLS
jgi:hypothetical protein